MKGSLFLVVFIAEMVSEYRLHGIVSSLLCTLFCTLASFHAILWFKIVKCLEIKHSKLKLAQLLI